MNARPETVAWLRRYYELLDQNRVGEAIREFITGVGYRLLTVLEGEDGSLACGLEVTYIKHDGSSITLPGSLLARVEHGRFLEQRVYIDQGPLLA